MMQLKEHAGTITALNIFGWIAAILAPLLGAYCWLVAQNGAEDSAAMRPLLFAAGASFIFGLVLIGLSALIEISAEVSRAAHLLLEESRSRAAEATLK